MKPRLLIATPFAGMPWGMLATVCAIASISICVRSNPFSLSATSVSVGPSRKLRRSSSSVRI